MWPVRSPANGGGGRGRLRRQWVTVRPVLSLAVLSLAVLSCGGSSKLSVSLESAHVRLVGTEAALDVVDATLQDADPDPAGVEVVFDFRGSGGDAEQIETRDLLGQITIDGQNTAGIDLGSAGFESVFEALPNGDGFLLLYRIGTVVGASDLTRIAEGLDRAGVDTDRAPIQPLEDRGHDGVLEVEVRVFGEVDVDGARVEITGEMTFDVVESDPDDIPDRADDDAVSDGVDDEGVAELADGTLRLRLGGVDVSAPVPDGWEVSDVGAQYTDDRAFVLSGALAELKIDDPDGRGTSSAFARLHTGMSLEDVVDDAELTFAENGWEITSRELLRLGPHESERLEAVVDEPYVSVTFAVAFDAGVVELNASTERDALTQLEQQLRVFAETLATSG